MTGREEAQAPAGDALDAGAIGQALTTTLLGRGARLRVVPRLHSTNAVLLDEARRGVAAAGTVLLAGEQTGGRGRGDHRWESPPGAGLYLSVLLQPQLPPERLGLLTLACGVAVCETCARVGVRAGLRWPNDVLARGRKLAGILCELATPPTGPPLVVAGIGLNVGLDPAALPPPLDREATSLARELRLQGPSGVAAGEPPGRAQLAALLLGLLEQRTEQCASDPAGLLAAWELRWPDRGRRVKITDGPPGVPEGTAAGVDGQGALLLLDVPGRSGVVQLMSGSARAK